MGKYGQYSIKLGISIIIKVYYEALKYRKKSLVDFHLKH